MQDMEQILSNFVPYADPYIVLAWKEPVSDAIDSDVIEIRTEVLWDQTINLNTPTETTYSDKFRIVADTSFTIKGWLFRNKNETSNPIYFIDTNFINTSPAYSFNQAVSSLDYEAFFDSLTADQGYDIDTISLSGIPEITNVYFNTSASLLPVDGPITVTAEAYAYNKVSYTLLGANYNNTEVVMLSSNSSLTASFTALSTTYTGGVSGYLLPTDNWTVLSDEVINITLPLLLDSGRFDIIIKNPAGWKTSAEIDGFYFNAQ